MAGLLFAGIDLAWSTGFTGVAAVDDGGRLVATGRLRTDDEIASWIGALDGRLAVVAVDAPLVVPNEARQRLPERLIGRAFGGFGASAHATNKGTFGGATPRALQLSHRFGWLVDPDAAPGDGTLCIEVYPHPALVGLFELGYRLDYKRGGTERRAAGFSALMQHLESIPELNLSGWPRWAAMKGVVASPAPGDLNRVEDELDAIVCAHLAWLWRHRRQDLHVYGNLDDGYIVATPPPTHRPVRPVMNPVMPTTRTRLVFERVVVGRPTGYAAGANEQRWKAAVRDAFHGCVLPADRAVKVELDFVLAPDQRGRNEPDLDNLIKSTVDALVHVVGVRFGTGSRIEADDVRVVAIAAAKRARLDGEDPGARILVSEVRWSGAREMAQGDD